ncbi:hypothetical protein [Halocalculus aciditolerans]|uniref:SWIM-type domain-containing protein n=1 Tax=Halocalculus aciditolerans TaxID=1383812 RepID=A0A830F312_9EURY|nr:hypothetical protein [Halocalculus aciditolerans]GGL57804.1 hypothetical protein GCM10009039_14980 [Halocalculus aciditolerans]
MTYLDFKREAEASSTSWERADPHQALIERQSPIDYVVTLRDGATAHRVTYAAERGARVGYCDCKGFQYRDEDDSPCAHLCVLRKADFIGATSVDGQLIEAGDAVALEATDATETEPELVTDGGREPVEWQAGGQDERTFGQGWTGR